MYFEKVKRKIKIMNISFFIGNVVNIENFKFILNSKKHKSKIALNLKLLDKNTIKVVAYDETADYVLRNVSVGNTIFVQGKLRQELAEIIVIIKFIRIL